MNNLRRWFSTWAYIRITWSPLFGRSGEEPEILLFSHVPRWYWIFWSRGHALRNTVLKEMVIFIFHESQHFAHLSIISPEGSLHTVQCSETDSATVWLNILPLASIQGQSKYDCFLLLGKSNWRLLYVFQATF